MNFFKYIFLITLFISCSKQENITIAISKAIGDPVYQNYIDWLKSSNQNIEIIDLYAISYKEAVKLANSADGILLSGGPDIHPEYFGKANQADRCSIEPKRDTLELKIIQDALKSKKPIFGICRGMQVLNVALGGSLIIDIPDDYPAYRTNLHQTEEPGDAIHKTYFQKDKLITDLLKLNEVEINCNHHQGIENLATGLVPSSFSEDGMIESFEWKSPENKSWLMAVQWHPERNSNKQLFAKLADKFISEVEDYKKEKK